MINLDNGVEISNFTKPYLIAELGSNHNGDIEIAKDLISQAKAAGADCVKFQSWTKDSIFSKKVYEENFFLNDDYRDRDDYNLEDIVEEYSIGEQELMQMSDYAKSIEIDISSTPFSVGEVDFLVEKINVPFLKIASMDLNNYPFIEYVAKTKKPVVISTGFSELHEIDKAVSIFEKSNNKRLIIMHCVATYPPKESDTNLNSIQTLMSMYPDYPIGFSDHSLGTAITIASGALGVCMVEKHFTLDKNMEGWDHKISADRDELAEIANGLKRVNLALGSSRIITTESTTQKEAFRRSIVAARHLKKGDILVNEDFTFKRPGTGLSPESIYFLVGRTLKRDVDADSLFSLDDIV
jgi:N-acetylneuraminate synthase